MDARAQSVRGIINAPVQYLIPFFQRHYSWRRRNWERLWGDLQTLLDDPDVTSQHFLGPLVCTPLSSIPGALPEFQLIDGQQRLTTLTVLLAALRDIAREQGADDLAEEVMEDYLIHKRKKALQRYKVVPRVGDREILIAVIESKIAKEHRKSALYRAWQYFRRQISEWAVDDGLEKLRRLFVALVERLSLVVITIDGENPYEIFESLNSTGLPLEESDLIRNFIFMQVPIEDQDEFNTTHWVKFEKLFEESGKHPAVPQTQFYRTYLMRNGDYSKAKFTFVDFKDQNRCRNLSPEEQVAELRRFLSYELMLRRPDTCEHEPFQRAFRELGLLEITTAHPLLMNLLDRWESGKLPEDVLLGCFQDLFSCVLRRSICGESTRSYGRWFCEAIGAINDAPREDLQAYWLRRGWPDDGTFRDRLVDFPLYRRESKKCRVILERLEESYGHKEKVDPSTLSIEHVMPQTISQGKSGKAWKEMLGADWTETHERLLHTLGNLTLSGYNPDLGNRAYEDKRHELIKSNLVLNRHFKEASEWDEKAITSRGQKLAVEVAQLWSRPAGGRYVPPVGGEMKPKVSAREQRETKLAYWTEFLALLESRDVDWRMPKAARRGWVAFPIGKRGFRILAYVNVNKRHVGVALSCRGRAGKENFEFLRDDRDSIEEELGAKLLWQELPSQTSSHITQRLTDANPFDRSDWQRQHTWLADKVDEFRSTFIDRCKSLGMDESEVEGRHSRRKRFWEAMLQRASERTALHSKIKPGGHNHLSTGAGHFGMSYNYIVNKQRTYVEFYLDRGKGRQEENKALFDQLAAKKDAIEAQFGEPLSWERLDKKRGCRIRHKILDGGYRSDEEDWPALQDQMIDAMVRLDQAIAPAIRQLQMSD